MNALSKIMSMPVGFCCRRRPWIAVAFAGAVVLSAASPACAQSNYSWNVSANNGDGTWNTTSANWSGAGSTWVNGTSRNATFVTGGTSSTTTGTITIDGTITSGTVNFGNSTNRWYSLQGGSLNATTFIVQGSSANAPPYFSTTFPRTIVNSNVAVTGDTRIGRSVLTIAGGTFTTNRITSNPTSNDWGMLQLLSGVVTATNGVDGTYGTTGSNGSTVTFSVLLSGGTMSTSYFKIADHEQTATNQAVMTFDGATIRALSSTNNFIQLYGGNSNPGGLKNRAFIAGGDAIFDTNGFDITVSVNLLSSSNTTLNTPNTGGVSKRGSGTLTLSGTNNYAGPTSVAAGTLIFSSTAALYGGTTAQWTANRLTTNSGATSGFAVYGSSAFTAANLDTLRGLGTGSTGFLPGSSIGIDTTGTTFTYASNVSNPNGGLNALGLTKLGSGTLTLSGSNSYTGLTTISAGILSVGGTSALQGTSAVTINGGAGLTYTGGATTFSKNVTVTAGSGTGTIRNSGGGLLTLSGNLSKDNSVLRLTGGAFDVTGVISGATPGASDLFVDAATVTLSNTNTYNGPTIVFNSGTLTLGINNAIPNASVVTLGDASSQGTLNMNGFTDSIAGLTFGSAGGTLRLTATSTAAAPLTSATGTMTLTNGTLDLAGSGSTAGLYRVLSAQSVSGSFASVIGASAAYQLISSATSVDYQQRAVLGAVTVNNPVVSIITGGSAAFTYTVANSALSGGASLGFSSGSLSANLAGASSGTALAGGSSGSISGLVFTGTAVGAGQTGTFGITAPTAFGATTATGTVSVNVLNHSLASFNSTDTASLSLDFGTYDNGTWTGGGGGNGSLGFDLWNIASGGFLAADTAGLAFYDVIFTSGTDIFGTTLANFANLTAGTSNAYTASVLTPGSLDQGTYQGVYTLKFRDQQNLSGAANTRDLTLTMNVIVVPEPGAMALAGIGIVAVAYSIRRRKQAQAGRLEG